jgi:hypothetical protein
MSEGAPQTAWLRQIFSEEPLRTRVSGTPRKTLDETRRDIDRTDEHVRRSLERVASGKSECSPRSFA